MSMRLGTMSVVLLCLGMVFGSTSTFAAQTKKTNSSKKSAVAEAKEVEAVNVKLFDAMKDGLVKVAVTANNPFSAKVTVSNVSEDHLIVELPSSFALTPVLAQYGGGGYGGGGGGMGGMGGGMGGYGGGMGGMGGGRYNIVDDMSSTPQRKNVRTYQLAPKKSIVETVRTVCLEHGKADPTPRMKYEMRPLADVTTRKEVQLLCEMRGNNAVHPDVAQAAVWNLNNDISWEELNAKQQVTYGEQRRPARPYFAPGVLEAARRLSDEALVVAEQMNTEEKQQKRDEQSQDLLEYMMEQDRI